MIPATPALHGNHFFTRENGRRVATPLLLCLLLIEISDVIFALDSVPAIFGVTLDPFIVFTSNIFAILGLRSLYFAIANLIGRFEYLKIGLAAVLVFIGAKMTISRWVHIGRRSSRSPSSSGLLGASIAYSLLQDAPARGRHAPPAPPARTRDAAGRLVTSLRPSRAGARSTSSERRLAAARRRAGGRRASARAAGAT